MGNNAIKLSMFEALENKLKQLEPTKKTLYFEGKIIMVSQILILIDKLSYAFDNMGIKKGDVITMNLPNMVNAVATFYAANKLGIIVNSLHPLLPPDYVIRSAKETNSKLLVTLDSFYYNGKTSFDDFDIKVLVCSISDHLPLIKKLVYKLKEKIYLEYASRAILYRNIIKNKKYVKIESNRNDAAVYLHSGGTTNQSKIIELSNDAIVSLKRCLEPVLLNHDPMHHTGLMVLPIFHGFGLGVCMHALLEFGFEIVLIPKFEAKAVSKITKKENITIYAGVPVMFSKLLNLPEKYFNNLKNVELLFCGGDKLSDTLKHDFDKRMKEIGGQGELLEGYGLTECVTVCAVNKPNDFIENSMGFPLREIEVKVIDEDKKCLNAYEKGEICISGPTLMTGYLDSSEEAFIELDGKKFIKTGDYGYLDKEGRIFFFDRLKRIMKISGISVFPCDIEKCANVIEGVAASFAVYEKEEKQIVLHVETQVENKDALQKTIMEACTKELISYAIPKKIVFHDALPRTIVGKIKVK